MTDIGCRVDGCGRPVRVQMRQLCSRHYEEARRAGDIPAGQARTDNDPPAAVGTCENCGVEFQQRRGFHRYCKPMCQRQARMRERRARMLAETPEERSARFAKLAERNRNRHLKRAQQDAERGQR